MKNIRSILLLITTFLFISTVVDAKVLPRYSSAPKKAPVVTKSATSYVSAKLRSDRKALMVSFLNLGSVRSIDYTLTYDSTSGAQGVNGSVEISGSSIERELVFGTASKGVYTYHTNIKNMKFVVTIVLKTGKTVVKKYTVKP